MLGEGLTRVVVAVVCVGMLTPCSITPAHTPTATGKLFGFCGPGHRLASEEAR